MSDTRPAYKKPVNIALAVIIVIILAVGAVLLVNRTSEPETPVAPDAQSQLNERPIATTVLVYSKKVPERCATGIESGRFENRPEGTVIVEGYLDPRGMLHFRETEPIAYADGGFSAGFPHPYSNVQCDGTVVFFETHPTDAAAFLAQVRAHAEANRNSVVGKPLVIKLTDLPLTLRTIKERAEA